MASIRFDFNRANLRTAALTSPQVRAVIAQRAEAIAAQARSNTDDPIVTNHAGRSRARSYVRRLGSGELGESKDRALGKAMDAGR